MDKSAKVQMIYESFDILKDSWPERSDALMRLICKMFDIDNVTAIEMWKYLLKNNENLLDDYHSHDLIEGMIEGILFGINVGCYCVSYDNKNENILWKLIFNDKEMYSYLYGHNSWLGDGCSYLLSHLITAKDPTKLLEVLNLMIKNKWDNGSFGKSFIVAIEHISDDVVPKQNRELLEEFVANILDKKIRAEAFTALLSLDD